MATERKRAQELYEANDYTNALQCINDSIEKGGFQMNLLLRAAIYAKLNNRNASQDDLKAFVKLQPDWPKEDPLISGFLRKEKQKAIGATQKRFFYLKNKFLFWYRSPLEKEPLSAICLEDAQMESNMKLSKTCFKLDVLGVSWILDALGDKMYVDWVNAMKQAIQDNVWNLVAPTAPEKQAEKEIRKRSAAVTSYSGYLFKRGEKNNGWKRRWFEMKNELLSYYESPTSKALGTIDLRGSKLTKNPDQQDKYCFQIHVPDRVYSLYCDSQEERERWVTALSQTAGVDVPSAMPLSTQPSSSSSTLSPTPAPKKISFAPPQKNDSPKKVGRVLGNSGPNIIVEVKKLEQPVELQMSSSSLDFGDDEKKRNEEAIRQAKLRREQERAKAGTEKSRQEELQEPLLENMVDEESLDYDDSARSRSNLACCAKCTIL